MCEIVNLLSSGCENKVITTGMHSVSKCDIIETNVDFSERNEHNY